jgi:hypothetical protein
MADQVRELTADELKHVGGGFEAVEHSLTILHDPGKANFAAIPTGGAFTSLDAVAVEHSLTILQATSQQMTYMMQVVDSVIRDI